MADHLTREQLKTDEVGEALESGVDYLIRNWKRILIGAGLLVVAIVAGALWYQARGAAQERAAQTLAQAVDERATSPQEATEKIESVIKAGGNVARAATLYRATLPDADPQSLWQAAADEDSDAVTMIARVNLVSRLRHEGSFDQALELLQEDAAGLPEDVRLYQQAQTLTAAGRESEAAPLIRQLLADHPSSPWTAEYRPQAAG